MSASGDGRRHVSGLAPVVGTRPRVLILGSIPGARSLAERRYYVGPGNRFWALMSELLGFQLGLPYEARVARLTAGGIALWDVLARCERDGSMDASIVGSTEEPNDVGGFLVDHPGVALIALNGRKAEASFRRRVSPRAGFPPLVALPSTSGANARTGLQELVERWSALLPCLEGRG